jgi:2-amino-4-hydroxy-6-hydroxymethyldihydropteridine diphosphokinase
VSYCAIGLGSNLGDSPQILTRAIDQLGAVPHIQLKKVASYYRTKPIGPPQPDYLNSAATLNTSLLPWQLLDILQDIENSAGRTREVRWGARTLDLDLLFYGAWQIDSPRLQVPHPRLAERGFVLVPLAEIAGDWECDGCTIEQLRSAVDCSDVVHHS